MNVGSIPGRCAPTLSSQSMLKGRRLHLDTMRMAVGSSRGHIHNKTLAAIRAREAQKANGTNLMQQKTWERRRRRIQTDRGTVPCSLRCRSGLRSFSRGIACLLKCFTFGSLSRTSILQPDGEVDFKHRKPIFQRHTRYSKSGTRVSYGEPPSASLR